MNDDYGRGYRDGYDDGYSAGQHDDEPPTFAIGATVVMLVFFAAWALGTGVQWLLS